MELGLGQDLGMSVLILPLIVLFPVTCEDPKGLFDLKYYAGHVGTSQDSSLVLSPSWGWAVTRLKK